MPFGRIAGRRVGRARLGRTRRANRRATHGARRSRRRIDRFCLVGGGTTRIGYRGRRAALVLTSSIAYGVRGVRRGSRERTLRRRLRGERRIRIGRSSWYVGLADRAPTASLEGGRRFLRSF